MQVRTAKDIGLVIRDRRHSLDLTQADLARQLGVSRQWISQVERGKKRADLTLILRTLNTLGMTVDVREQEASARAVASAGPDIDKLVRLARRNPR